MKVTDGTLDKLGFERVKDALAERCASRLGQGRVAALAPDLERAAAERQQQRIAEVAGGGDLSLGGVADVRPLLEAVREGRVLEGSDILEIAYTLDAAATLKRGILESERPALGELAARMGSFDGALRLVREQIDGDGKVRDDATPKLREIRRRLNPLRGRIRERLQKILEDAKEYVQDAIITLRRDRYVIPVRASMQSRVPGIALDSSDSGATVFLEPQAVVPMNNELAMLEFEERDEVRRILIALGKRLAGEPQLDATLEILAELDLVNAAARLAEDWRLARPEFVDADGGGVRLVDACHPLIEDCVPNTITLSEANRLLIVTGPNAGGKTVLIKTLGVAALMAHAGLFVAAAPSPAPRLPWVRTLMTDIGDEQSIEASLSTYAGHLTNLKRIVLESGPDALVLIDELGSGTDPDEGAALSQAILEAVLGSGALGLVTTHLAPLKVFASETAGVQNAAMRFDVDRLAPTFELTVGQPGRSYALSIAERLGLPDDLLARASEILGPEGERLESLLETLEAQREAMAERLREAEEERETAREEAELLREQIATLRAKEDEVLAAAAERADEMLQDTLERAKELKRTATSDREQRGGALEEIQRMRREAQRTAEAKRPAAPKRDALEPGTVVRSETYGAEGPIVEVRGGDLVLQLGLLKVEVPRRDVRVVKRPDDPAPQRREGGRRERGGRGGGAPAAIGAAGFDRELNIRGERVEAGIEKVRDFILEAHAMRAESVRILHGKGTGALRDAVRGYLRDERMVERYEDAVPYEGGHGVTVAYLRG